MRINIGDSLIKVEIGPDDKREIERIFPDQNVDEAAQVLAQQAFEELLGWLSGGIRYTSLTEQSIERVINLYAQLMPDEEPNINYLYNRFNIPYGRAKYIIQVISERQLRELNERALIQLVDAMKREKEKAEREGLDLITSDVRFQIGKRSGKILITVISQLSKDELPIESFGVVPSHLPDIQIYKLALKDVDKVLKAIEKNYAKGDKNE